MSLQYDPNGTIASEMSLQGKPWDVCLVNPFTVAVSLPYNKPWNMSYVSTIAIVDTIQMKTGKLPMKLLVTSQSQMWVVGFFFKIMNWQNKVNDNVEQRNLKTKANIISYGLSMNLRNEL